MLKWLYSLLMRISSFGELLTFVREQSDMSIEALAEYMGVEKLNVVIWERNEAKPDCHELIRLYLKFPNLENAVKRLDERSYPWGSDSYITVSSEEFSRQS